jgi:lambda family phage tail tape measure protein
LSSFFKDIGKFFLDMAMKIIQKMIAMAILNTIIGLLPGGGGGGDGGDFLTNAPSITGNEIGDFGGGTSLFAKGGVFAKNKIVPYAKGGIVNKPTMFAYANGGAGKFGLMGEAGPEAIMPLSRGANGKLGVAAQGGGSNMITVNVDATGSSAEGDDQKSKELGQSLGMAIQSELIKQKRPGGILA